MIQVRSGQEHLSTRKNRAAPIQGRTDSDVQSLQSTPWNDTALFTLIRTNANHSPQPTKSAAEKPSRRRSTGRPPSRPMLQDYLQTWENASERAREQSYSPTQPCLPVGLARIAFPGFE
ncbi:Hypothetical_protein [Hexamita inflata]|uniref:Hypothetical_protein n=1 Tax=Hexamita inflata TaxID=28002 RepID=A0AA86P8I8_9EUKA|nr:Hypothetical protein HINF_LOCUS21410 [Hexamita inflata]